MTSEQREAHLRLLAELRSKVKTHVGIFHDGNRGRPIGKHLPDSLVVGVESMIAEGHAQRVICLTLHIGSSTFWRIKRFIDEKKKGKECK